MSKRRLGACLLALAGAFVAAAPAVPIGRYTQQVLAAAGVFAPNGDFHLAPPGGWQELGEL